MKRSHRFLSLFLCALFLLNMIPMSAWAAEEKGKPFAAQRSSIYTEYDTLEAALKAVVTSGAYEIQTDELNPAAATIVLTADTTISHAISLGNDCEITLDLNGYILDCSEDDLFVLSDSPSNTQITLKNGTITNAKDFLYALPTTCSLTILDGTYTLSGCLVNDVYGQLTVQDGTFTCGNSFVSHTYSSGEVLIQDGTFDASEGWYGFDSISGQVTVQNGTFLADDDLFYFSTDNYSHGTVLVEGGNFTSNGDLFYLNSGKNARLTVNGGTFTVQESEDYSSEKLLYLHSGAVAEINGGTFAMEQDNTAIMVDESSVLNINHGSFSAISTLLDNSGTVNMKSATFTSKLTDVSSMITNNGQIKVQPGYVCTPGEAEWNDANTITFSPKTMTITFYTGDTQYHQATGPAWELTFPQDPKNKENGSPFLYWVTAEGKQITDLFELSEDTDLYAVYADQSYTVTLINKGQTTQETVLINTPLKEVPGFLVDDPLFYQWVDANQQAVSGETKVQSNLTLTASYTHVVTTYDGFLEALEAQKSVIRLGGDIKLDTSLTVDYSCSITSQNDSKLIRADQLTTKPLLTIQGSKENPILVSLDGIVLDGQEIESEAAAIHVTSYATLEVSNTLIQNNINTSSGYQAICGGGISNAGTLKLYDGTILRNNQAESGGGVYCAIPEKDRVSKETTTVEFYMFGGEITENTALSDNSFCLSAGGGVAMDSSNGVFSSFYMYGGKISNNSAPEGSGGGITLGCGDHGFDSNDPYLACEDCNDAGHVPFLFYGGEITDNDAKSQGGGVWLGCSAMDMRGGLIARNTAGIYGGGISNCCDCSLSLRMTGGTITKNRALYGGGIGAEKYSEIYGSISGTAMIYDNVATDIGDDLYETTLRNDSAPDEVLTIQNRLTPRPYQKSLPTPNQVLAGMAAGNPGSSLPSVYVDLLPGEPEPDASVKIPFMGWYVDGVIEGWGQIEHPVLGIGRHPIIIDRFANLQSKHCSLAGENINDLAQSELASLKSVWAGHLVLYKANDSGGDYAYDTNAYLNGSNAPVMANHFQRSGYLFAGWNTKPDGTGAWYHPGDRIVGLKASTKLYAQWEEAKDATLIKVYPANVVSFEDGESRSGNEYKHFPRPFFQFELVTVDETEGLVTKDRLVNVPRKVDGQADDVSWFYFESDPDRTLHQMKFFIDSGNGPQEYVFTEEPPYIYRYPFRIDYYYVDPATGQESLVDRNDTNLEPMGMYKMRTRTIDSTGNGKPDIVTATINGVTYDFTSQAGDLEVRPINPDKPTYYGSTTISDEDEVQVPPSFQPATSGVPETFFPAGTRFANVSGFIAGEGQAVRNDIRLLTDEVIRSSTANAMKTLTDQALGSKASDYNQNTMFFLDLVNYANGNSVVHPIQAGNMEPVHITVFYPYPNGTDQNTNFKLYHFPEITRSVDSFGSDWSNTTMEEVALTKLQHGILFTVDSFSPFRLLWQKTQSGGGGGGGGSSQALTILKTDATTGVTLAGAQFELKRADGSLVGTYTTGANGTVTVSDLSAGTYTLRETLSPSGYVLNGTPIEVKYPGGAHTVTVKNVKSSTPTDLDSVNHLAYIIGYEDGKVHPNGNITRAEVSTAFYRLLTAQRRDAMFTKENAFRDVTESLWYNKAVSSMANGKYITGYPDGTFGGNQTITRAEFVAIAARFVAPVSTDKLPFRDIQSSHWAYGFVMTAVSNGWLSGYPDGTFQPDQRITRAEAMTIINRMLNRKVEESGLVSGYVKWPDNDPSAWYYHAVIEATNSHEYTRKSPSDSEHWTTVDQNKVWHDKAYYEDPDQ